jgi:OFA family oxalate/formate antiporter-like MFS transporter
MQPHPPSPFRGWTVVIGALGVNLIIGGLYAWSVMGRALVSQWHWTKTQAMLPFAASSASFAVTMIFAGRWQDRIGPRYVAMLGGILFGLGMVLSSFVHTCGLMVSTFGLVGGMGIGLGYCATTPPSIKWFPPARKGLITGIVVSGVGLAAVYMSPLTDYLLKATSIQRTFLILGLGAMVLAALLAQLLANPPDGYVQTPGATRIAAQTHSAPASRRDLDWHEMLRTGQFYQLWLMFVLSASAGLLIIGNITLVAQDQAPGWDKAFLLVMVVAIFNTCGRFLSGFVSDRIGRTNTMILAFVLQAINMFLFVQYRSPALLLLGSALTGLCYGTIFTLFPAATADFYGMRNLGVNYGLVFSAFGVAGVTGSVLGGRVRDLFGAYTYAFIICGAMLLIGAALAFFLKAPKTEAATLSATPTGDSRSTGQGAAARKPGSS